MSLEHRFLFRVDAGLGIGLGHLQRTLSLASALRLIGAESVFLTWEGDSAQDKVSESGFVANRLNNDLLGSDEELRQVVELAESQNCGTVVLDSYRTNLEYQTKLVESGLFVVVVDDFGLPVNCHVVINTSVDAIENQSSFLGTRILTGPAYALLRNEFWNLPNRITNSDIKEILVTMGGADGARLTSTVIETLDMIETNFNVTVIIGPFFTNLDEIKKSAISSKRDVEIIQNPSGLCEFMRNADIAVSAAGQTLFELAATGTPAVAIRVAENQMENIASFAEKGVVLPVDIQKDADVSMSILKQLNRLIIDEYVRRTMSFKGRSLVDGNGAMRCANALIHAISEKQY